ncbi:hypothetical protein CDD82_1636 [Ophiocordyceps australis]|uniref:Integral membrane bound transporter domain-containing protein n=1 Tax=Ophiocordyceps australis TaxID=1399860 RepID=A0A2C5YDD4_9HYPO|nr:hypothetical protein CDD82_1636 [Ophiocordyceps australis]
MSSSPPFSPVAWPRARPSKRCKTRNGTFVIPRTGQRSRRQVTLRASTSLSDGAASPSPSPSPSPPRSIAPRHSSAWDKTLAAWQWAGSPVGHQVLKCTLAYLLGSLGTFWPLLSDFLGRRDGKHIVATITVYFHPARTVGSMLEAVFVAIVAVAYALGVSVLSMAAVVASRSSFGSAAPAYAMVLVLSIGGGLGFIGWVKQKLNQPLVNVASTLASIAIISIVTKEDSIQGGYFSDDKIVQVLKMLLMGITITVAVNLLVWRVSARHVLRSCLATSTVCLGDKLSLITKSFLDGSEQEVASAEYRQMAARYDSAYAKMSQCLREAKLEYYFLGQESIYQLDKRLCKSKEALNQAIGGLRSALDVQLSLVKEPMSPRLARSMSLVVDAARRPLSVIHEADDEPRAATSPRSHSESCIAMAPFFESPSDIFSLFMALLGPSMKSLVFTLSEILRESPFDQTCTSKVTVNGQLQESLRDALRIYKNARANALQELYRSMELGRCRSEKTRADIEEVAAACGHFSFTLLAVTQEMDSYLEVLDEVKQAEQGSRRSWKWLKFWQRSGSQAKMCSVDADESQPLLVHKQAASSKAVHKSALPRGIPRAMAKRHDSFNWDAAPQASRALRGLSQRALSVVRFLAREDISFGIKVGIGAIAWAMFAFIPSTRPMYQKWRGEWGLLSYMIVVGMTTGASNTTSTARLRGTLIGAACACLAWLTSQGNAHVLALAGWLTSYAMFYLILVANKAPLGRISLLAYNVIVLYAYSLSQQVDDDDDDEGGQHPYIFEIAWHRVTAVTLGIVWGMVVCRVLWPISARRKFREGLSVLYLQMGLIWKRGPLGVLMGSRVACDYMCEGEQAALQRYALRLDSLRDAAKSEFELRGPFAHAAYGRIMSSTHRILDALYAMRLVSQRRTTLTAGERALLDITAPERHRLCQLICLVLQVLASSIMLEYPLSDAVPTVDAAKDALLASIYRFRLACLDGTDEADEADYALVYAYTLVSTQVALELERVREEIEGLFGVLGQDASLLEYT